METKEQAVEDILVVYHNIFARHRMDIGWNTDFKLELTPKEEKAKYSQNFPMPIQLKDDLIVELATMHKYRIITVLLFSNYASPGSAQKKPNENLRFLVDLRKINTLKIITPKISSRSVLCQMEHNTWQEKDSSARSIASKLITGWKWRTNSEWKCLNSFFLAECFSTKTCTRS